MGRKKICNENCFLCPYTDCIAETTPSERKKWYNQDWRARNKEKCKVYNKKYYQEHKEEIAIKTKIYRQKPLVKQRIKERERQYRLERKEKKHSILKEVTNREKVNTGIGDGSSREQCAIVG